MSAGASSVPVECASAAPPSAPRAPRSGATSVLASGRAIAAKHSVAFVGFGSERDFGVEAGRPDAVGLSLDERRARRLVRAIGGLVAEDRGLRATRDCARER